MTFWNMNSELKESDEQTQPVLIMIEEKYDQERVQLVS